MSACSPVTCRKPSPTAKTGWRSCPRAVRGRQRAHLLIGLANAAGLAGDEERAVACHRELAALTEAGSDYIRRAYSAYSLWALGAAAWRRGDLDRATGLQQQSLRLRRNDRMGTTFCVEALAWIAASRTAVRARRGPARRRHRPVAVHGHDPGRQPAPGGPPAGLRAPGPAGPGRGGVPGRLPPWPGTARRRCPSPTPCSSRRKSRRRSRRHRPYPMGRR